MVHESLSHEVRHCVRTNYICFLKIQSLRDLFLDCLILYISLNAFDTNNRVNLQKINRNNGFPLIPGINLSRYNLRPATRGSPHVNDLQPRLEQLESRVDFRQLERRPGSEFLQPCLFHVVIIHMPVHPNLS